MTDSADSAGERSRAAIEERRFPTSMCRTRRANQTRVTIARPRHLADVVAQPQILATNRLAAAAPTHPAYPPGAAYQAAGGPKGHKFCRCWSPDGQKLAFIPRATETPRLLMNVTAAAAAVTTTLRAT